MISQLSFGYFSLIGGLFLEEYSRIQLSVVASNGREKGSIFWVSKGCSEESFLLQIWLITPQQEIFLKFGAVTANCDAPYHLASRRLSAATCEKGVINLFVAFSAKGLVYP